MFVNLSENNNRQKFAQTQSLITVMESRSFFRPPVTLLPGERCGVRPKDVASCYSTPGLKYTGR